MWRVVVVLNTHTKFWGNMFSIFTHVMLRDTRSEPGLPVIGLLFCRSHFIMIRFGSLERDYSLSKGGP